jgi:hypothetical protein
VVNMPNRPHVHVRLRSLKLLFGHSGCPLSIKLSIDGYILGSQHSALPAFPNGAHDRNRTGDLVLTKDVLYRLSYVGTPSRTGLKIFETHPRDGHPRNGAGDGNRTHTISLEG